MRRQPELIQLIALSVWLGAATFFSAAVAPALFASLPSRTLAGEVVGRLLPSIFYAGILAGILLIVTQWRETREWNWRGRETAGGVMALACAIAQFVIAPRIERIRAEIGGPIEVLSTDDVRRIAFGRLHGASVAWLGVAMLAAAVGAIAAARGTNDARANIHTF
jgi:hypothetical protein